MQVSKNLIFSAGLILNCWLAGQCAFADQNAEGTVPASTNLPPLEATVKLVGGPDLMPTYVTYMDIGTNKFGFALPGGFRISGTEPNKLTLVSADFNSLIIWRVASAGTNEIDAAWCRNLMLSRHPGGKITDEMSMVAGGQSGPAFQMRWSGPNGLEREELSVFVPSPVGILEFNLVSSLEKFGRARQKMNTMLLTFRTSDEKGKLEMPTFSNKL